MSINTGVKGAFPMSETQVQFGPAAFETTNQIPGSFYEIYPGYASQKRGTKTSAIMLLGKTWIDFRRAFVEFFDFVFNQPSTRKFIKEIMMLNVGKYIPVRTGHLYDTLFRSLYFTNAHWGNSRHVMIMFFRWPLDRPFPIKGLVAHTFPAVGYADPTPIIDMPIKYQAPNITFIGVGPKGGLLYGLNDPAAISDPTPTIIDQGIKQMRDMFRDVYQGMIVKCIHRGTSPQVRVSGGGTNVQLVQTPPTI
jgi:hypothetical protein